MFLSVSVTAGGIQSAVSAVSPGRFPMLIQRPGSIPPEIFAVEQQRRASGASQLQHVTAPSLATRVCSCVLYITTPRLSVLNNTDVLQICGITGIEAFLLKGQLRWAGHVMRMPEDRVPKQVFCGVWTARGCACGPVRRYKDSLKENMKKCEKQPSTLSVDSQDRSNWRSQCQEAVEQFKDARVAVLQHKRAVHKGEAQPAINLGAWPCDNCSRSCHSRIVLYTHQLAHR